MQQEPDYRPLIAAGVTLGIGLGGFLDGIILHQLLQVHNMMSAVRPKTTLVNMEINMFWDGLFHVFTWLMTALGLALLWGAVRRERVPLSTRCFVGSLVMGWGIFNGVEGLINHHLLHLHHVVERLGLSIFDWAFLGASATLIAIGWALIRSGMRTDASTRAGRTTRRGRAIG